MPGTSPEGWPYILDNDHPIEYPAYSQSLATLMDSRWDTYQSTAPLTPSAGWSDFSATATTVVTRAAGLVAVEFNLKKSADLAITAGGAVQIATVPAGFLPIHDANTIGGITIGGVLTACRMRVQKTTGVLQLIPSAAGTIQANGIVLGNLVYQGA